MIYLHETGNVIEREVTLIAGPQGDTNLVYGIREFVNIKSVVVKDITSKLLVE